MRYTTGAVAVADKATGVNHERLINSISPTVVEDRRKRRKLWSWDTKQSKAARRGWKFKPLETSKLNPNVVSF